jgi:hypothetical protein
MRLGRASAIIGMGLAAAPLMSSAAMAQSAVPWWDNNLADVSSIALKGLIFLFVFAVLIESALAVIFNWRLFLEVFNGRGMKTLIMIVVSAIAVHVFGIDVVRDMASKFQGTPPETAPLEIGSLPFWITALILAGGSSGVYNILVALGYRQHVAEADIQKKPATGKAWISVRTIRGRAVGPINVHIHQKGPANAKSPLALAGIITTKSWRRIWHVFFLDWSRIPRTSTGREVDVGQEYEIRIEALDAEGKPIPSAIDGTYTFAERAIVDFEVTL